MNLDTESNVNCNCHCESLNEICSIDPITKKHSALTESPFKLGKVILGSGNQGTVYLSKLYIGETAIDVAIKRVKLIRNGIEEAHDKKIAFYVYNEAAALSQLDHPNIIKYFGLYCDYSFYYLIMEYIEGADLFNYVIDNKFKRLHKEQQHDLILQMALAVEYLHSKNYIHLDIKLENIMVKITHQDNKEKYQIVFIDLAYSRPDMSDDKLITVYSGSVLYADPDILKTTPYRPKAADIWSLGTTIFCMFTQTSLFNYPEDGEKIFIKKIIMNTPVMLFDIPDQYRVLLKRIFVYNSQERIKIDEIVTILKSITV